MKYISEQKSYEPGTPEYREELLNVFPTSMEQLNNYVPFEDVDVEIETIPASDKTNLQFWLQPKL